MKPQLLAVCAFGLAAVCIIGAIVLAALGKPIPANLWTVAVGSLAGGAGITVPNSGGTTVTLMDRPPG
jgi:hypothetical protein